MNNLRGNKLKFFWWITGVFLVVIPFWHILNLFNLTSFLPRRMEYIDDFFAILMVLILTASINWNNIIRKQFMTFVAIIALLAALLLSSLVFNPSTSNLFWPGFTSETLPLLLAILLVINRFEAKVIISKAIYYIFLSTLMIEVILTLFNNSNPHQSIILYILASISVYIFYIKNLFNSSLTPKILIILNILVHFIVSPYTLIINLLTLVLIFIKHKELPVQALSFGKILLVITTLFVGIAFNLSTLEDSERVMVYSALKNNSIANPNKLALGYGSGNIGNSGIVNYGTNQELLNNRELISDMDVEFDSRNIAKVSNWVIQSVINNGIIYLIGMVYIFIVIYRYNKRKDHLVFLILIITTLSLVYDPLGNKNAFYLFSVSLLLI